MSRHSAEQDLFDDTDDFRVITPTGRPPNLTLYLLVGAIVAVAALALSVGVYAYRVGQQAATHDRATDQELDRFHGELSRQKTATSNSCR